MRNIRVGVIGLGGICRQRHIPGLKALPQVELVAVANRSRESSEAAARDFDIPKVCDSWKELLEMEEIDAVLVGAWPYMHHPISIATLEAGKHLFCQARMAMNLQEAIEMYQTARYVDKVAMICPVPFGLSIDKTIARMLREDHLGEVHLVRVQSLNSDWSDPERPMNWRKDHRLSGLNVQTLGMYAEVIHRWFGPTRSLYAVSNTFTTERLDELGHTTQVKIPDQVLVQAGMDKQIPVQYTFSGLAPFPVESIEIFASKQSLFYDVIADILYSVDKAGKRSPVSILPEDAYDLEHWQVEADFINAIQHGTEYHPNFIEGIRYMQVVQAVHDSAEKNKTVYLPDTEDLFL